MADLLLHIGGHKTGTSFLQGTFHRNRARLAADGIHYPDLGPNDAHHALGAVWLDASDIAPQFFGEDGPEGVWTRFLRDYADREGTVMLSAENFSRGHPRQVDMADLARRLAPFERVRVVYTMRRQTELIQSLWSQVAKNRRAPTLSAYVQRAVEEHLGGGIWVDHNKVYDNLLDGFAPEQILLLDYAQCRAAPGGVLGTFLRLMDSDIDPATLDPLPPALANISPAPLAMYVASRICDSQVPPPDLLARVQSVIASEKDRPTSLLTRREDGLIRRTFRPLNAELVRRARPSQPGVSFHEDNPVPGTLYRNDLREETWARIAAALYRGEGVAAVPEPPRRALLERSGPLRRLWARARAPRG